MDVREHDLPGVGKKFACTTNGGDRMTVIIHNTGHREIYHFDPGEEYPSHAVRLEDQEARKLGAILGGAYFQPAVADTMDMVFEQLTVEWSRVGPGSPLSSHTLAELDIRRRSGASVIAILREGKAHPNPQPDDRVEGGDTLLVVGDRDQVARFRELARGAVGG
jgi:TrkA domain protein